MTTTDNLEELLSAYLSRPLAALRDPASFARYASGGKWQPARHLMLLNEKLLAVSRGECKRLIVMMPPRHGKSWHTSKYFPAWFIGSNPDSRIILAGYEADFAAKWGREARTLLEEHSQLFGVKLNPDSSAANRWDLAGREGGMNSLGVGGAITGRGANVFLIDDPLKNSEEAHSQTFREKQWEWYQSVCYTRLEPGASIILTMARWHEDDLAGRLLEESNRGGDQWDVVRLPAIAGEDDQLGRQPGEALWPERYDVDALASIERTVGGYVWSALYQQQPAPITGNILKRHWFRYWRPADRTLSPVTVRLPDGSQSQFEPVELPSRFDYILQSWDMTFKDTASSDFVVGQAWGGVGADRFLLDQTRARLDFPATLQAVRSMSKKWPSATLKLVEDKANGSAVIASLQREIGGFIPIEPEGGKIARCHAITAQVEGGNVYVPHPHIAGWVSGLLDECVSFPSGKNDDQVDSLTQALNWQKPLPRPRALSQTVFTCDW